MDTEAGHEAGVDEAVEVKAHAADVLGIRQDVVEGAADLGHGALAGLGAGQIVAIVVVEERIALELEHHVLLALGDFLATVEEVRELARREGRLGASIKKRLAVAGKTKRKEKAKVRSAEKEKKRGNKRKKSLKSTH